MSIILKNVVSDDFGTIEIENINQNGHDLIEFKVKKNDACFNFKVISFCLDTKKLKAAIKTFNGIKKDKK